MRMRLPKVITSDQGDLELMHAKNFLTSNIILQLEPYHPQVISNFKRSTAFYVYQIMSTYIIIMHAHCRRKSALLEPNFYTVSQSSGLNKSAIV